MRAAPAPHWSDEGGGTLMRISVNGTSHQVDFVHRFAPRSVWDSRGEAGFTGCFVDVVPNSDGSTDWTGLATCSVRDVFRKATGRKIALGRALKVRGFHKSYRRAFFEAYFKQSRW